MRIDPSKKRKDRLYVVTAALAMTLLGGYLLVREVPRIYANVITTTWPTVDATITKHRRYSKKLSSEGHRREIRVHYMDLLYEYEVDGKLYTGSSAAVEYHPNSDEVLQPGDTIRIWYEPSNPSRQIYDRKTYTRIFRIVFGLGLFVVGGFLGVVLIDDYRRSRN